jgi:hypothetical protein
MISKLYPLGKKPVSDVLPFMRMCCRSRKTNPEAETNKLISGDDKSDGEMEFDNQKKNMNDIISKNGGDYQGSAVKRSKEKQIEEGEDLFEDYGFGINSWFSLLRLLIKLYTLFSVVAFGVMYLYDQTGNALDSRGILKYTMGNLGYSSV